jgi:FdhD protein
MSESSRRFDVQRMEGGRIVPTRDAVAVEEPLEIRIGKVSVLVTMRTPGNDAELAAGFLFTEGVIGAHADIEDLAHCDEPGKPEARGNILVATLANTARIDLDGLKRNFYATSSCGICGKASIEQVRRRAVRCGTDSQSVNPNWRIDEAIIQRLIPAMRRGQCVFAETGGLHAAALFDQSGSLLCVREDIGRHNAVDKVIGWALLDDRLPLPNVILCASGRASFEIVQKAVAAGIGVVAAVSASSSLAIELARDAGITLLGFVRDGGFVVYSEALRPVAAEQEIGQPGARGEP